MPNEKRNAKKSASLIFGLIMTLIGGMGFLLATISFLPIIVEGSSKILPSLMGSIVWLIPGLLLIKYGISKSKAAQADTP